MLINLGQKLKPHLHYLIPPHPFHMDTGGKNWSYKETLELIALWSDDVVQEELEEPRNKDVYQRICAKLHEKGLKEMLVNAERR